MSGDGAPSRRLWHSFSIEVAAAKGSTGFPQNAGWPESSPHATPAASLMFHVKQINQCIDVSRETLKRSFAAQDLLPGRCLRPGSLGAAQ
jgi:hypothetical protein